MIPAVYKTKRKSGMYLYVREKDNFEQVPKGLLEQFGKPELVMLLALDKRDSLAGVDKQRLRDALESDGYYLQMPPKEENLLLAHREALGLSSQPENK